MPALRRGRSHNGIEGAILDTAQRLTTLTELISTIDADQHEGNLSSAIRLFVLGFYRDQIR